MKPMLRTAYLGVRRMRGTDETRRAIMRKIIQIAVKQTTDGVADDIYALCDDGTLWNCVNEGTPWKSTTSDIWAQVPNVPQ